MSYDNYPDHLGPEQIDRWYDEGEAEFDTCVFAVVWEVLAKWLWLLGGQTELETWTPDEMRIAGVDDDELSPHLLEQNRKRLTARVRRRYR